LKKEESGEGEGGLGGRGESGAGTGVSVVRRGTHCLAGPLPEDNYYRSLATLKLVLPTAAVRYISLINAVSTFLPEAG